MRHVPSEHKIAALHQSSQIIHWHSLGIIAGNITHFIVSTDGKSKFIPFDIPYQTDGIRLPNQYDIRTLPKLVICVNHQIAGCECGASKCAIPSHMVFVSATEYAIIPNWWEVWMWPVFVIYV